MIFSPALIQIAYQSVIRSSIQIKDYAMRYRLTRTVIHTVIQIGIQIKDYLRRCGIQIKDYLRRYGIYIKGYVTRCRKSKQEGGKRKPKNDV
jgi:predicted nucleic acid-binding Zn ribbon protein